MNPTPSNGHHRHVAPAARVRLAHDLLGQALNEGLQLGPAVTGDNNKMVKPKRITCRPVVTVRHRSNGTAIAFTAVLARKIGVPGYEYAVVHADAQKGEAQFELTNDPVANGGTFSLCFNGGSSKKDNSPGRIIQVKDRRLEFLEAGPYWPRVSKQGDRLVITISRGSGSRA